MNILIVDDDGDKRTLLAEFVGSLYPEAECRQRGSYQSGCEDAIESRPDIVLLDMAFPTYDVVPSEGETGGRQRPYGGRDVLREMTRHELPCRVIIVTQYDTFGEGEEVMSLDELRDRLAEEFQGTYVKTVFFQSSSSSWRAELAEALSLALVKGDEVN